MTEGLLASLLKLALQHNLDVFQLFKLRLAVKIHGLLLELLCF